MSKENRLVFSRLLPTGFPTLNHTPQHEVMRRCRFDLKTPTCALE